MRRRIFVWLMSVTTMLCTTAGCPQSMERGKVETTKTLATPVADVGQSLTTDELRVLRDEFPGYVLPLSEPSPPETIIEPSPIPTKASSRKVYGQPLATAVLANDVATVKTLIDAGQKTNFVERGRNLLHLAARKGHAEVCELLLDSGMDVQSKVVGEFHKSIKCTAVHDAISSGSVETLKLLLDRGGKLEPIEGREMNGRGSPDVYTVFLAISSRNPEMLEFLLDQNQPVDSNFLLYQALSMMTWRLSDDEFAKTKDMVKMLLAAGVELQPRNPSQDPVIAAIKTEDLEILALLTQKVKPKYRDEHFRAAASSGSVRICRMLISKGVKAAPSPDVGKELMRYALMKHRNPELVDVIAEAGERKRYCEQYDVSTGYSYPWQYGHPLYNAALKGDIEFCRYLIETFSTDDGLWQSLKYEPYEYDNDIEVFQKGNSILFASVYKDHADVMELLLKHALVAKDGEPRVNINAKNKWGSTVLHEAVNYGAAKCVQQLLAAGADPNARRISRDTPLHLSVKYPLAPHKYVRDRMEPLQSKIFPMLVAACSASGSGTWLEATNDRGETVLMRHAAAAHPEICKKLIQLGADPNSQDERRQTCLHHAIRKSYSRRSRGVEKKQRIATCKVLIKKGTKIEQPDAEGSMKYYCLAAEKDLYEVCDELLRHGVKRDLEQNAGDLMCAAATFGRPDQVKQLLELGVDVNAKRRREESTALHCAVSTRDIDMIRLLIEEGVDVDARDKHGQTPIFCVFDRWAGHMGYFNTSDREQTSKECFAILNLLLKNGADPNAKAKQTSNMSSSGTVLDIFHDMPAEFRELLESPQP